MMTATYADLSGAGSNAGLTFANADLGTLAVSGSCCTGEKGNIDCDCLHSVDIADLTAMVNSLFITFDPLCCVEEADLNGDSGVDISDITQLIDNLFISFLPFPTSCP
jgi:hypothetical protein